MPLRRLLALAVFAAVLVLFPFAATALIPVGTFETLDNASDVEVVGGLACLTEDTGLWIIDVSNPAAPVEVSVLLGGAVGVEVVGGLAYVAAGSSGLRIIDVSNPEAPVELGALDTHAQDVEVDALIYTYPQASSAHDAERMRRPAQYFKLEKFHRISAGLTAISAR